MNLQIPSNAERKSEFGATMSPKEFAASIDISVHDRVESIEAEWLAAEKTSSISVYQRFGFVQEFINSGQCGTEAQPFVVMGKFRGNVVFILPFSIHGNFIRRLQFIGGSHVNFNLGLFPKTYLPLFTPRTMGLIIKRIAKLTPGMGYIKLCCQPEIWQKDINPLLGLTHQKSANPAFVLDLKGGFDAALAHGNAKRKRKKFRQQCRMAENIGGYSLVKPETIDETAEIIDAFFAQKSYRLKHLGIRDVFSDDCVHDFVKQLAVNSLESDEPLLRLYALRVGDDILAVFGGGVLQGRISGYFSSIDMMKNPQLSPGEMLLYLVVEDACKHGYRQIDLGAGEERYKQSWCSESISMHDVILPLSWFSVPFVTIRRVYGYIRRIVRENRSSWNAYKSLRKIKAKIFP